MRAEHIRRKSKDPCLVSPLPTRERFLENLNASLLTIIMATFLRYMYII